MLNEAFELRSQKRFEHVANRRRRERRWSIRSLAARDTRVHLCSSKEVNVSEIDWVQHVLRKRLDKVAKRVRRWVEVT